MKPQHTEIILVALPAMIAEVVSLALFGGMVMVWAVILRGGS